jgi:hypothetical protein
MGTVLSGVEVFGRPWQLHSLIAGTMLVIVGAQVVGLGVCARAYARYFLRERTPRFDALAERLRLEHGLVGGALLVLAGVVMGAWVVSDWIGSGFGRLGHQSASVVAATLVILGVQTVFTSFLLSILGLRRIDRD